MAADIQPVPKNELPVFHTSVTASVTRMNRNGRGVLFIDGLSFVLYPNTVDMVFADGSVKLNLFRYENVVMELQGYNTAYEVTWTLSAVAMLLYLIFRVETHSSRIFRLPFF